MSTYITKITLSRAQFLPIFIPISTSIRVFKKIYGDNWYELDRVDLMEGSSPDTYSYDELLYAILFNPVLIGNTLQIQYEHDGVPNPGVVDLVPSWIADQAIYNYNCVISGLYALKNSVAGNEECGSKYSMTLDGGMVRLGGRVLSVGSTYWDLNKFGARSGDRIVTSTLFYMAEAELSDTQKRVGFIKTPRYIKTTQYAYNDGRGVAGSLTELNTKLKTLLLAFGETGFIELLRLTIVSQVGDTPPDLFYYYEPRFRVLPGI